MQPIKQIIPFMLIAALCISCGRNCGCTKKDCDCIENSIELRANTGAASTSFNYDEISSFLLIITDKSHKQLDSVNMEFTKVNGQDNYNMKFLLNRFTFSTDVELKSYNFLLKNEQLNRIDTISEISYSPYLDKSLCNRCVGCSNEYIECEKYENQHLIYKGSHFNNFVITLTK